MIIGTESARLNADAGPSTVTVVNKGQKPAKLWLGSWGLVEPAKLTTFVTDREVKAGETFTTNIAVPPSTRLMARADTNDVLDVIIEPQVL